MSRDKISININDLAGYNTFVNPDSQSNLPGDLDEGDNYVPYDTKGQSVETRHRVLPKRDEFNENAVKDLSGVIGYPAQALPIRLDDEYRTPVRTMGTPGEMLDNKEYRDSYHQRRTVRIACEFILKTSGYVVYFNRDPLMTSRDQQDSSGLPGDNSAQQVSPAAGKETRENEKQPAELFVPDYLPGSSSGSGKVIPYDGGFKNYKSAKTVNQIIKDLSQKVVYRAKPLQVEKTVTPKNKKKHPFETYKVSYGDGYKKFKVDVLTGDGKTLHESRRVHVRCECPAWRYHGSEYAAKADDYLLGSVTGTGKYPKKRDPKNKNKVCKHVLAVFNNVGK